MTTLSDIDILRQMKNGKIIIKNFDPKRLNACTYDVLLGHKFLRFDYKKILADFGYMSLKIDYTGYMIEEIVEPGGYILLMPGEFVLAVVDDFVGTHGNEYDTWIMGKSSVARCAIEVEAAGYGDPNNALNFTLEICNQNKVPFALHPGLPIAQVMFTKTSSSCIRPYGHPDLNSKYHRSTSVQATSYHKNLGNDLRSLSQIESTYLAYLRGEASGVDLLNLLPSQKPQVEADEWSYVNTEIESEVQNAVRTAWPVNHGNEYADIFDLDDK
jgi:dCTP deaminase